MSRSLASVAYAGRLPWRTVTVAVFLSALVVQGFFSFAVRPEPYPVIRMPSFGSAASPEGFYSVTFVSAVAQFDDGSTEAVRPMEIMGNFRFSTARPSWDHVFGPDREGQMSEATADWLVGRVETVSGKTPVKLSMCWMTADVDVHDASLHREQPCRWTEVAL